MSVVENLCQREGIKVESQKSLSLITKMSSVLLQIEVSFVDELKGQDVFHHVHSHMCIGCDL